MYYIKYSILSRPRARGKGGGIVQFSYYSCGYFCHKGDCFCDSSAEISSGRHVSAWPLVAGKTVPPCGTSGGGVVRETFTDSTCSPGSADAIWLVCSSSEEISSGRHASSLSGDEAVVTCCEGEVSLVGGC